jgi:hypothetical protein
VNALLPIGYLLALVLAAGAILWVRDRFTRPRELTPRERDAQERTWRARLLAPQWDALAKALGAASIPAALRQLYQDRDLVLSTGLDLVDPRLSDGDEAVWSVDRFRPADRAALGEQWEELPRGSFAFAECDGDPYYVVLGDAGADGGPVHHFYHDGGQTVTVAPTLTTFLACCRAARTRPGGGRGREPHVRDDNVPER